MKRELIIAFLVALCAISCLSQATISPVTEASSAGTESARAAGGNDATSGNNQNADSGNTAGNNPGNTSGNTPSNTPGNTSGNTLGNTPGNTSGNTPGNTSGNTSSNTPGNSQTGNGNSNTGNTPGDSQTGSENSNKGGSGKITDCCGGSGSPNTKEKLEEINRNEKQFYDDFAETNLIGNMDRLLRNPRLPYHSRIALQNAKDLLRRARYSDSVAFKTTALESGTNSYLSAVQSLFSSVF
ncbi:sericin-2-like isoform X3 [Eurosta solidaginis]|uniref:sericin-2-like isoform X3 n=1 Tax=Eurosta solidaginis TaxID=178769 RepID=UPI0035312D64